jgi:hypothetical protein
VALADGAEFVWKESIEFTVKADGNVESEPLTTTSHITADDRTSANRICTDPGSNHQDAYRWCSLLLMITMKILF